MSTKTLNLSHFRSTIFDYFNDQDNNSVVIITKRGKGKKALVDLDLLEDLLEANDPKLYAEVIEAKSQDRLTHQQVFGDI